MLFKNFLKILKRIGKNKEPNIMLKNMKRMGNIVFYPDQKTKNNYYQKWILEIGNRKISIYKNQIKFYPNEIIIYGVFPSNQESDIKPDLTNVLFLYKLQKGDTIIKDDPNELNFKIEQI